jgi:branched-chain amino acid transport system permease protein
MLDFLQAVLDGVMFGAIYALIGIGFTLVFGVMHKINMAYAAASIGSAYAGLLVLKLMAGAPPWLVFLGAFASGGLIGYLVYLACFHFIPRSSPLATLMSTVGMLLLIDEIIVHATEGRPQG